MPVSLTTNTNKSFSWIGLSANDVGEPLITPRGAIITTVHMTGTFGGTVSFEGTVNGTDWFVLQNAQGDPVALTATGSAEISTAARAVRPSAGSGVSDVNVFIAFSA